MHRLCVSTDLSSNRSSEGLSLPYSGLNFRVTLHFLEKQKQPATHRRVTQAEGTCKLFWDLLRASERFPCHEDRNVNGAATWRPRPALDPSSNAEGKLKPQQRDSVQRRTVCKPPYRPFCKLRLPLDLFLKCSFLQLPFFFFQARI